VEQVASGLSRFDAGSEQCARVTVAHRLGGVVIGAHVDLMEHTQRRAGQRIGGPHPIETFK
jgi:hypothetical protein